METKCTQCGEQLERTPCQMRRNVYCSTSCQLKWEYANGVRVSSFKGASGKKHPRYKHGESRGSKTKCLFCDEKFVRTSYKQKYCSQSCQLKYEYKNGLRDGIEITKNAHKEVKRKGLKKFKDNPTTLINHGGYKEIYIPQKGWKKYHHYVWEKSHPPLKVGYCLHHINCDKLDNRLKNLIMLTHHDHHKIHTLTRERDEHGNFK